MEKSAKSTLKVRKKTRVFIGKLVVGVALCDNRNNKSFVTRYTMQIISKARPDHALCRVNRTEAASNE